MEALAIGSLVVMILAVGLNIIRKRKKAYAELERDVADLAEWAEKNRGGSYEGEGKR